MAELRNVGDSTIGTLSYTLWALALLCRQHHGFGGKGPLWALAPRQQKHVSVCV